MDTELISVVSPDPKKLGVVNLAGELSTVGSSAFTRRKFLLGGCSAAILFALRPLTQAQAFWPSLLRLLAVSIVVGIGEEIGRMLLHAALNAGHPAHAGYEAEVPQVSSETIDQRVSALAEKVAAQAIWARQGCPNPLVVGFRNRTEYPLAANFHFSVRDAWSNKEEDVSGPKVIIAEPFGEFLWAFQIQNLPCTGVKKVFVQTDHKGIVCEPTRSIVVAEHDEVFR